MSNTEVRKTVAGCAENAVCDISDSDMALINGYTRRVLEKSDVYVFSVILCDNDIDRDGERFTVESLFELEKLFVGKTGIFDHSPSAKNQTARIFACEVENVQGRKTATGDDYFRLRARAYIPKAQSTEDIILSLDSGILKEVSVGCAAGEVRCNICGAKGGGCSHIKGEEYGGKVCCYELMDIYDAYEWSFVAVPAQKNAGVIKTFGKLRKDMNMEEILKSIYAKKSVQLSDTECEKLCTYIDGLKKSAKDGVYYRDNLTKEVLRLSAIVQPEISRDTMESVTKDMTVMQLKEFKSAFEAKASDYLPATPQLYREKTNNTADKNGNFRI